MFNRGDHGTVSFREFMTALDHEGLPPEVKKAVVAVKKVEVKQAGPDPTKEFTDYELSVR